MSNTASNALTCHSEKGLHELLPFYSSGNCLCLICGSHVHQTKVCACEYYIYIYLSPSKKISILIELPSVCKTVNKIF